MYLLILSHIQRGEDSTIDPCVPPTGANQSSSGQAGTSVFQRGFESLTFDMEHHGTTLKWWGPRLFIGIPLSEYDNHQYSGYSIIPYNHQPTRVLNTAHLEFGGCLNCRVSRDLLPCYLSIVANASCILAAMKLVSCPLPSNKKFLSHRHV